MNDFQLDPRLAKDCHVLGMLQNQILLLMNNSLVPWFILVPKTSKLEIHDLSEMERSQLYANVNKISRLLVDRFQADKVNIGAIGNIVKQMHVHIVGRKHDDFCWPGVVWGRPERIEYTADQVDGIRTEIENWFVEHFTAL